MIPVQVVFESGGAKLAGSLYPAGTAGRPPGVVLLHGFLSNRMEKDYLFVRLARRLAAEGCSVLSFDFAGCGESEGDTASITPAGQLRNALDAVAFLRRTAGITPERTGILGYSLGGLAAAAALGRDRTLSCGVLWAPVADLPALVEKEMRDKGRNGRHRGTLTLGEDFVTRAGEIDAPREIASSEAPVLVIHGTDDETVPPEHGRRLADAAPGRKMLLFEHAGHGFGPPETGERLLSETTEWFLHHLKG